MYLAAWLTQLTGLNMRINGPLLQHKPKKYILNTFWCKHILTKVLQYILKLILLPYHIVASHTCALYDFLTVLHLLSFMMSGYFIVYCETVFFNVWCDT